ncbi:MAG TPA: sensor domain-containing diguanylate cyclase [Burkholderiales bacterium]
MTWRKHDVSEVIEQVPIGVAVTLPLGTVEYANPRLLELLQIDAGRVLGALLRDFRASASASRDHAIRRRLCAGASWQGETQLRTAGGEVRHVLESVFPLRDRAGRLTHFIHFLQDMGALEAAETLSSLAYYDSLTGLPNRNLFNDRLSRAIAAARRRHGGFSLLYVDVDRFKDVNDTRGHDAGDELLRQVALRLQKSLRKIDTVARLGGDEFVVILDQVSDDAQAAKIAAKILASCSGEYELEGAACNVTLSLGISRYPRDAVEVESLVKCADKAMYRAKASGGNDFRLREPAHRHRYRVA